MMNQGLARVLVALGVWFATMCPRVLAFQAEQASRRLVAVGDVHGDFERFTSILRRADLIDAAYQWTGGDSILVQTGDFLDRGAQVRPLMDLLMKLEEEASRKGGRVEVLLGNHEVLNLVSDFSYVSPEAFSAFWDDRSEKRRQEAFKKYARFLKKRAQAFGEPEPAVDEEVENEWVTAHPPGLLEYQEALGPKGKYGKWLKKHSIVTQIGQIIFLHAGIHPHLVSITPEAINERVERELEAFELYRQFMIQQDLILPFSNLQEIFEAARKEVDRYPPRPVDAEQGSEPTERVPEHIRHLQDFLTLGDSFLFHPEGPLWYRGFAEWTEEEGAQHAQALVEAFKAGHFVAAHTPQVETGIRHRFNGKIFLIDTALSRAYPGGRPSALEIIHGKFSAIYLSGRELLFDATRD